MPVLGIPRIKQGRRTGVLLQYSFKDLFSFNVFCIFNVTTNLGKGMIMILYKEFVRVGKLKINDIYQPINVKLIH